MSSPLSLRVTEARAAARAEAAAMEIDANLISRLVDRFYERIREDDRIGPVFEDAIGQDWDEHLATMKRFWSAIVFHDGGYAGRPMPKHMALNGLRPEHFAIWLDLFAMTLDEIGATPAARAAFLERAERIGAAFRAHIFG